MGGHCMTEKHRMTVERDTGKRMPPRPAPDTRPAEPPLFRVPGLPRPGRTTWSAT